MRHVRLRLVRTGDDDDLVFYTSVWNPVSCGLDSRRARGETYGPTESCATSLILGMFSNVPASGIPSTSCWLTASRRRFATAVMVNLDRCVQSLASQTIIQVCKCELRRR